MRGIAVRPLLWGVMVVMVSAAVVAAGEAPAPDKKTIRRTCRRLLKEGRVFLDSADYRSAAAAFDSVLVLDSGNADAYYQKGLLYIYTADSLSAAEELKRGVQHCPLSSRLKLLLARLKIASGLTEEAEQLVDRVLAIKPREAEALYLKGTTLLVKGDTAQAVAVLEEALRISRARRNR